MLSMVHLGAFCSLTAIPRFYHALQVEDYISFVQSFPGIDGPEVFGLHPNADLTFRNKEGQQLLATLMETQPKQATGGTGQSREDVVSVSFVAAEPVAKLPLLCLLTRFGNLERGIFSFVNGT